MYNTIRNGDGILFHSPIHIRNKVIGEWDMAKLRETPCKYYICVGQCEKGREAEHNGYCQKCNKYYPRAKVRHLNKKKEYLNKICKNERYE